MQRISKDQFIMLHAHIAALRSEDPYNKVGAAAATTDGRVVATAYNGLLPGYVAEKEFWDNRDERLKYMVHAEQNLCSLFKRGEAKTVAVTIMPCPYCLLLLCTHGITRLLYSKPYEREKENIFKVAKFYNLELICVDVRSQIIPEDSRPPSSSLNPSGLHPDTSQSSQVSLNLGLTWKQEIPT